MPFKIVRNDITKMEVDVIVNTANEAPQYSTGVDTAVYHAAGEEELLAERKKIGWMKEGEVALTPGFKLPAKYIIHAVSPCYIDGTFGEEDLLRGCYQKSLQLAYENKCKSIAFPLISTGSFGYPKEEGMRIAIDEISAFLLNHTMLVYIVVFDTKSTKLGLSVYPDLEAYIDHNYVCEKRLEEYGDRYFGSDYKDATKRESNARVREFVERSVRAPKSFSVSEELSECQYTTKDRGIEIPSFLRVESCNEMSIDEYDDFVVAKDSALKERMKHMSDTFSEYLLYLISEKGMKNVDVYKRALVDKRQFSKLKNNLDYHPEKGVALRLCIGAKLNLDETKDLLARAGYALSPCDKRDIIFSYFFEKEIYDITEIAVTLEEHGLPCIIDLDD